MANDVVEFHLENGLQVLLKPVHSAPVVSNWIWYRVRARNELPGRTSRIEDTPIPLSKQLNLI